MYRLLLILRTCFVRPFNKLSDNSTEFSYHRSSDTLQRDGRAWWVRCGVVLSLLFFFFTAVCHRATAQHFSLPTGRTARAIRAIETDALDVGLAFDIYSLVEAYADSVIGDILYVVMPRLSMMPNSDIRRASLFCHVARPRLE